jgi:transcriptional regulator with XRE-family HTH domain
MEPERLQKTVGEMARTARERLGLTQAEVARQVGLVSDVYGRVERGAMMPAVPTLRRMALVLRIPVDALLAVNREDGAESEGASGSEAGLPLDLLGLVNELRSWSPERLRWLLRMVKLLEEIPDEE